MNPIELWKRFQEYFVVVESLGLRLDVSRMRFDESLFARMARPMADALAAMERLEKGRIANPDENRMVGHYWLRAPELAPTPEIRAGIERCVRDVKQFAADVHAGAIVPEREDAFYFVLVVGIGGSALGAQFVGDALGSADDPMMLRFLDNTDPEGIDRALAELEDALDQTLTVVISKSGTTIETRNAMLEVAAAYRQAGLSFPRHAVAVTCEGSVLHQKAVDERWLRCFPMWDWVGGRTSVLSAAGLVPLALQGVDTDALLAGARECDIVTRKTDVRANPAAMLSLIWHEAGEGRGRRDMVVLPYCDRLALFGRYLQQLVMESLGKETDRRGRIVHQGLTVYGNKGSTDQHAFVQQLREGPDDFFVTFIEIFRGREGPSLRVEDDVTAGDYLGGFLHGTRAALWEKGRQSLTITLDEVSAQTVGALIALFERAVGLYAELIDVNAYHQPGVEAGKKAASEIVDLQRRVLAYLRQNRGTIFTVEPIADGIGRPHDVETIFHLLEHAAANRDHGIRKTKGKTLFDARFSAG
jgi:glucose-6-phosphate isomerase